MFTYIMLQCITILQNMGKQFTENDKKVLRCIPRKLAIKYGCTPKHVNYVLNNNSALNTALTQNLNKDLIFLLDFFKPLSKTGNKNLKHQNTP